MCNGQHVTLHPDVPGGGCWYLSAHDVMSVCSTWNKIWGLSILYFVRTFVIYNKIFWLLSIWITSYLISFDVNYIFPHDTTIYLNPHNSSKWGSRVTRRLGYKHIFFQNVVSTKQENCHFIFVKTQHVYVLACWKPVKLFQSLVKLCIGGLQKIAVSWAFCNF